MNDSDGTTTSSPGPIPAATSARCSAAVHEETATAWPAPIAAANACSNSATRGPCATQPEATAAAAAAASSSPSHGRITGISHVRHPQLSARTAALLAPATMSPAAAALVQADLGFQPRRSAASDTSARRRVTAFTPRGGPNSSGRSLPITRSSACASSRGSSRSRCRC